MPSPQECLDDANKLAAENRRQFEQTPAWRFLKRRGLNREWMELAEYRQMVMAVLSAQEKKQPQKRRWRLP